MQTKKKADRDVSLNDRLFLDPAFAGIRDAHQLVFIYAGPHRPEFVDHLFRLMRAGRKNDRKLVVVSLIYDLTGLPDVSSRQRYVDFAASCADDTLGAATVVLSKGLPEQAHRAVLAQMNEQGRHDLPTFAAPTEEEGLAWLVSKGATQEEIQRLRELADELRAKQAALVSKIEDSSD